jgi:hypothetical protein
MAVIFRTGTPSGLLGKFDAAIHQIVPAGKIMTWEKTPSGHYTHKATDWRNKAFFYPVIEGSTLIFKIVRPKDKIILRVTYGYYHGHLIETFLNHFDHDFSSADASALPMSVDNVAA